MGFSDSAVDISGAEDDAPVPFVPVEPLSPTELRELYAMVHELHDGMRWVQANVPVLLAQLENNPMLKMMGIGKR